MRDFTSNGARTSALSVVRAAPTSRAPSWAFHAGVGPCKCGGVAGGFGSCAVAVWLGIERIVFGRRGVLPRRDAAALLARRSRSVSTNTKRKDEYSGPKPYSSRPPRLLIKSRTRPSPRAGFNRLESDPLSAMMQLTTGCASDSLILSSPGRPPKHACRAALSPAREQPSRGASTAPVRAARCRLETRDGRRLAPNGTGLSRGKGCGDIERRRQANRLPEPQGGDAHWPAPEAVR